MTFISFLRGRVAAYRDDERGQGALEYLGLIVLVAAIILAIFALHIPKTIGDAFNGKVQCVTTADANTSTGTCK